EAEALVLLGDTQDLDDAIAVIKANNQRLSLLAGDDVYTLKTLKEGGDNAIDMVVAVPWSINSAPASFIAVSQRLWKAPVNWRTAMSYDAATALIQALRQTKETPNREAIARILHSENFSMMGVSGKLSFEPSGDRIQESNLEHHLAQVTQKGERSRSGTGYDFEPITLPK
ncbi:MAG: receptor ligand binding family protein, partial [Leptolyngbyaceae cyanobacterium CRU_2_3]|nr:receptor ligand binding family protein [Leptolyngbyaceae cyanobacterium CRU_2_3]